MENDKSRSLMLSILQVHSTFKTVAQRSLTKLNKEITFEMMQVLVELWKNDGVNQQILAQKTFKDKSSLSYLINNLEKRNLVFRKEDNNDRRNKLIYLTEAGDNLRHEFNPLLNNIYTQMAKELDIREIDNVIAYMSDLNQIISQIKV